MIRAITGQSRSTTYALLIGGLWVEFPTWFEAEMWRKRL